MPFFDCIFVISICYIVIYNIVIYITKIYINTYSKLL